jgi:serine/threonine-protein kinase
MDRTEVTNAAFGVFASMSSVTKIERTQYPDTIELRDAGAPRKPVTGIDWIDARAYCEFLGKRLPTSAEWTRALRGRLENNPYPRRNFPWGISAPPGAVKLAHVGAPGSAEVGTYAADRSIEGVLDLAGNVQEWTDTRTEVDGMRVARGGNWDQADLTTLVDFMAVDNPRHFRTRLPYYIGVRCVSR